MKYNNNFYNNKKDVYKESVMKAFKEKLTETTAKLKKLKQETGLAEGWEDMMKSVKDNSNKGTGKFDKKQTSTGTQYTRKASTFTDGGDDSDVKKAKKKAKNEDFKAGMQVPQDVDGASATATPKKQGNAVTPAQGQNLMKSSDPNAYNKMKGIKTPAKTTTAVSDPEGVPVKEAKKAKKDYDKDGKIESEKDEVIGSRRRAAGLGEGSKPDFLDVDKDKNKKEPMKKALKDKEKKVGESHQAKTTMKHIKNPTAGEKKAAKDIKPGVAGYRDRVDMLKSAEKDGRLKERATGDYSAKKGAAGKDLGKPGKNFAKIEKSAGGGEKGKKIAGAVLAKLRGK